MANSSEPPNRFGGPIDYGVAALSFVDHLDTLKTKQAVLSSIQKALGDFGFENFAISELPSPFEPRIPRVLLMKVSPGWSAHYTEQQYWLVDPVVRACRRAAQPFEWSSVQFDPSRDPRALEVMQRSHDFGLKHGFTLPIHGLNGVTSCFAMSSSNEPDLNRHTKPAIHLMALYALERARELEGELPNTVPSLTRREIEVLTWAAAGKTASDISEILTISETTAIAHTRNAMQRLGATNKTHAVAIAMHYKLIGL